MNYIPFVEFVFLFFLAMIKHKTDEVNVIKVPKISSVVLFANRLPKVFNAKKTAKAQISISIALFFIFLFSCLYFTINIVNIKILSNIEIVSKDFISSIEFSFPAQTFS